MFSEVSNNCAQFQSLINLPTVITKSLRLIVWEGESHVNRNTHNIRDKFQLFPLYECMHSSTAGTVSADTYHLT